jgi:hypothetical protein
MKRMVMVFLLLFAGAISAAPIDNVTSSALMPGDSAIVNMDFVDPFGLSLYTAMIKARPAGASFDSTFILTHVPTDPYYLTTFEGKMHFANPAGPIQYYARIESDTLVMTQSYKNPNNQFPPATYLYADLAPDAVGDTMSGTLGEWLDLTGLAVTYSGTKLFVRLSNAGGGWPGNQLFTTYFIYGVLLINPDTLTMTVTALVNVNVPLLFQPGIYTVNLADTTFQRVAGISSQASANYLHMACNISDLLSLPNFPTWPPTSGHIILAGFTATMTLSGVPQFNDYTYPSSFIPATEYVNVDGNQAPVISNFAIDIMPDIGLDIRCDYSDADNNLPVMRHLIFDYNPYTMGSLDHSYGDTATFDHALTWPGYGQHTYYFRFSDGASEFQTSLDTVVLTPNGVQEKPIPSEFALSQNYPNPFNGRTRIEFNLAAPSDVELAVFDISGRKVAVLEDGRFEAGPHSVVWNGYDLAGQPVSSGVYFYKLDIQGFDSVTREMLLLK